MIRKLLIGGGLAAVLTLAVGCNDASSGKSSAPPDTSKYKGNMDQMKEYQEKTKAKDGDGAKDDKAKTPPK